MADVARRAGVSLSTVSHVVNGTRVVSPETAMHVRATIAELGYAPNGVARSLATSSTRLVGLAISISTNYYFLDIVSAIESACAEIGLMVLLADTQNDPAREMHVLRDFAQRRVDGVILAPGPAENERQERVPLDFLSASRLPFVLVDRLVREDVAGVALENVASMETLVDHLASHGHTRIALVANEPGMRSNNERREGFHRAMRRHGLEVDPAYERPGNSSSEDARRTTHGLLGLPNPPTAIASGNNLATIGVMKAVRDRSLRVPQDLALIGFDDFEWADCFEPRLTVIAQPCEAIGRLAAEMLVERIHAPGAPQAAVRLPSKLIIRRSCGCGA